MTDERVDGVEAIRFDEVPDDVNGLGRSALASELAGLDRDAAGFERAPDHAFHVREGRVGFLFRDRSGAAVGYGYASGFLLSKNIPMPESAIKDAGEGSGAGVPINPITGQRLDMEERVEMPEMTQEEKEREAERLFVLFERLKKTGVVNVQNPVEEAYRSGRIEELSDSD